MNPLTTVTPNAAAARAVSFIRSAARCRTPSGSPSPHTSGGRIPWWRASIGSADRLADEVRSDRPAAEPVPLEQLALRLHVAGIGDRPVDLEVVAPAGELDAVEAPGGELPGEVGAAAGRPTGR